VEEVKVTSITNRYAVAGFSRSSMAWTIRESAVVFPQLLMPPVKGGMRGFWGD
jgi:hypothetical protein